MSEVFSIEVLVKRAKQVLQEQGRAMSSVEVALALGVPGWSVDRALADAEADGAVCFVDGQGWTLRGG